MERSKPPGGAVGDDPRARLVRRVAGAGDDRPAGPVQGVSETPIQIASARSGRETPDEELMAAVGGPGLEAQMRELAPDRVEELITVYREHNEPLHDELVCCDGIDEVLVRLKDEGRRLGIVTAKRLVTVELAFAT